MLQCWGSQIRRLYGRQEFVVVWQKVLEPEQREKDISVEERSGQEARDGVMAPWQAIVPQTFIAHRTDTINKCIVDMGTRFLSERDPQK